MPMATPGLETVSKLPGAWALLKESILVYRSRFLVFLGLSLVLLLFLVPLGLLLAVAAMAGLPEAVLLILILALVIVGLLLSPWGQLASIMLMKEGEPGPGFKDLLGRSFPLILPAVWIGALWISIVMGGLVLLIIPGIILALSFAFVMQALVWDGDRGVAALQRSRFYVRGRWWSVAWRFIFLGICVIAVTLPAYLFEGNLLWIGDFYSTAVSLLVGPLFVIYPTLLYRSLKETRSEEFTPDAGQRKKYLALGVLGVLAMVAISTALFLVMASLENRVGDMPIPGGQESIDYGF